MKKRTVFLVFMKLLTVLHAQAMTIYGEILNPNNLDIPSRVYLKSVSLSGNNTLDSADVNVFGAYTINKTVSQYGQYYLFVGKVNYTLLLSPTEQSIRVTNQMGDKQKVWIENSSENDAYKIYREFNSYYEHQIMSLLSSGFSPDTINVSLKDVLGQYFQQLQQVRGYYPNTFTGNAICKMKQFSSAENVAKQNNLVAFMRNHYLDSVEWNNPLLLEELSFDETFMDYVSTVSDTSFDSFQKLLGFMAALKNLNGSVYKYYRRQVFNFLMLVHQEQKLDYFIRESLADKRLKDVPVLETQMNEVLSVLPGNVFVEVKGKDQEKNIHRLSEAIKKNNYTLLVFWEPDCVHCRESLPVLLRDYNNFYAKGFSIFAVNLSDEEKDWNRFLTDHKLPWTNVILQNEANRKDAPSLYHVIYTPTLVLINREGRIVRRFFGVNALEKILQKEFSL